MTPLETAQSILNDVPIEQLIDDIKPLAQDYIRVFKLLSSANQVISLVESELVRLRTTVSDGSSE